MKKVMIGIAVVSGALWLSGCSGSGRSEYQLMGTQEVVKSEKKMAVKKIEYTIQPLDRLSVLIYQYPELTPTEMNGRGILVDSSGYIALPLIHRVKVSGYTQAGAARMLESRYKKFLTDPALNLEVLNKRVYVLGEVNKPGAIPLENEMMTVLQAVANAGDLTNSALRNEVYIVSNDGRNNMSMRRVDLTNFNTLKASNLMLRPNDIVYVKPNDWKEFRVAAEDFTSPFVAFGQVAEPFVQIEYLRNGNN
jgi:polysaccharide export outer membrane protein